MTIISYRYKFIFIKTGKVAGTSVQMALEQICAPEDVCAPITKKKQSREGEDGYSARNHKGYFIPKFIRGEGQGLNVISELKNFFRKRKYWSHMYATDVRWLVGRKIWDSYFKFTIERNPWDKVVSDYYWSQRHPENQIPFEQWVRENRWSVSQFHYYTINGKVSMDHIIRYEHLSTDFKKLMENLGVEEVPDLPNAKSGYRKKSATYKSLHTPYTKERVEEEFAREIDYFGYTFD